jgi:hypothetical protein
MNNMIPIFAHAFGQNFSLPLPGWLFIFGGAAVVFLSFIVISLVSDTRPTKSEMTIPISAPARRSAVIAAQASGLFVLVFLVVTGLFGNPKAGLNINVTFCWVIFFVGFMYLTALFGNLWKAFNPFRTLVEMLERLTKQPAVGLHTYPVRLGYYPALFTYFIVICLELLFGEVSTLPQTLSGLLIFYAMASMVGSLYFGKDNWFRYMDYYSVFLRLVSKISSLAYHRDKFVLRAPFSGLYELNPEHFSLLFFIIFMLTSTMFDGFKETKEYTQTYLHYFSHAPIRFYAVMVLIGITIFICGLFVGFVSLAKKSTPTNLSARQLSLRFIPSIIPIAVGYNIAHYASYLLTNIQILFQEISDPFDKGWNIFGTAHISANPSLLSPYTVWYIELSAIVIGHIVAVYVAHKIASRIYSSHAAVVQSQLPMIILMVLYTIISLWIITQPLTLGLGR